MYSVLLSDYEKGMVLIDSRIRKILKSDYKAVIIAWTFPIDLDYNSFNNEWFKKN